MMTKEEKAIAEVIVNEGEIIDTFKFKFLEKISDAKFKLIEGVRYTVLYLGESYDITFHNNELVYFFHNIK